MKKLRNLKKKQKGFTLVEIIVVLVILAILAAAAIPTMLGFVDDAKKKSEVGNARAAYVAAQAIATEKYAIASGTDTARDTIARAAITDTEVARLTGLDTTKFDIMSGATELVLSKGKITTFTFKGSAYTITMKPGVEPTYADNATSPT